MRGLVVYESMFGNTQVIAEAIAAGISTALPTQAVEAGAAPPMTGDVVLLVVGGPTHAFGMSRPGTRADARGRAAGPVVSEGIGIREWLGNAIRGPVRPRVATFDTRISPARVPGSAARAALRVIRRAGWRVVAPAETFWVHDVQGPLLPGEAERARVWGASLTARVPLAVGITD